MTEIGNFSRPINDEIYNRYSRIGPKNQGRVDAVSLIIAELVQHRFDVIFSTDPSYRTFCQREIIRAQEALDQAGGRGRERWNGIRSYIHHRATGMWASLGYTSIPSGREFRKSKHDSDVRDAIALTNLWKSI